MSAQNKNSPTSDETCSSLDSDPLLRFASIPFHDALSLFRELDNIAREVYDDSFWDVDEHDLFFIWLWANASKVQRSGTIVQLVVDYFEAQRGSDMMYCDAYTTNRTLDLCEYVLSSKHELKAEGVLVMVYQIRITALTKLPDQDSYEQAVNALEEAAEQGYDVAHWEVFKNVDSCVTEKGLDTLTRKLLFYKQKTQANRTKYDASLIKELGPRIADSVPGSFALVLCHSAAPTGEFFTVPEGYKILRYGEHGTLTNTKQGAYLLNHVAQSRKLPEYLEGDTVTKDPDTKEPVAIPNAWLKSLVENSHCQEQPITFKTEKDDADLKAFYVAAGWPDWDGLYHCDPESGLTFLHKFAEDLKIRNGKQIKTSDVVKWMIDNDVKANTLVIKGCNVVHKLSADLRKRKRSSWE